MDAYGRKYDSSDRKLSSSPCLNTRQRACTDIV